MFLITTAEYDTQKINEPVLFLGEWCKTYSQRKNYEKIVHEVLPYHWDSRVKFDQDYKYIQEFYEKVLRDLVNWLNKIHGENYSLRYWRIIIGPWLSNFIQVLFDRYACLSQAASLGTITSVDVVLLEKDNWIPRDYSEFLDFSPSDAYNHFLYSWIIGYLDILKDKRKVFYSEKIKVASNDTSVAKGSFKNIFRKIVLFYQKNFPNRFNDIVLVSSYLSPEDHIKLQLILGQWPLILETSANTLEGVPVDKSKRKNFVLSEIKDSFQRIFLEIARFQIPMVYVEGYQQFKKKALTLYPRNPKVILTANANCSNEAFKFWTAENVDKGKSKFVAVQHGGGYGVLKFFAYEEHEIKTADKFYSWGWQSDRVGNVQPMSAVKLNSFCKNVKPKAKGNVLLVLTNFPRYATHLYSSFLGASGGRVYLEEQYEFVRGLNLDITESLVVRLYHCDYGWDHQRRWEDQFPTLKYDTGSRSIMQALGDCRLYVGTYNATTFLETFSANFPTVLFWNAEHWELRESVRPYFEQLKSVGILHDTPLSAAKKVNEIFDDPDAWWMRMDVQQAKNDFCNHFAVISKTWLTHWRQELAVFAGKVD